MDTRGWQRNAAGLSGLSFFTIGASGSWSTFILTPTLEKKNINRIQARKKVNRFELPMYFIRILILSIKNS